MIPNSIYALSIRGTVTIDNSQSSGQGDFSKALNMIFLSLPHSILLAMRDTIFKLGPRVMSGVTESDGCI